MNKLLIIFVSLLCLIIVGCRNDGNAAQVRTDNSEQNLIKIIATQTPEQANINATPTPIPEYLPDYRIVFTPSKPKLSHNENPKLGEHYKPFWIKDEEKSDNGFEPFCVKIKINRKIVEKCGYQDDKGEVIIKPIFARTYIFSEGLAGFCPKIEQICGYLNEKGQVAIEAKYQFVGVFSEDLGMVVIGATDAYDYDKSGYINKQGEFIIKPQYSDGEPFKNGIAKVRLRNLSLCINKKDEEVKCIE